MQSITPVGSVLEEVKLLPRARYVDPTTGIEYTARVMPEGTVMVYQQHQPALTLGFPARYVFFIMAEQNVYARDEIAKTIIEKGGDPAVNKFCGVVLPESQLLWA